MRTLARTFIENINSGLNLASAQKSTFEFMVKTFNQTMSVNNLSFNDFKTILKQAHLF
jgi:hypothetical protein